MPPQLLAGLGGLALLAGFLGGWTVRDWKADSEQLAAVNKSAEKRAQLERENGLQAGRLETFAASNQSAAIAERNTIERIYRDVQIPGDCAVPAAAVSVLEAARGRANAAAAGQLEPLVPAASASPATPH